MAFYVDRFEQPLPRAMGTEIELGVHNYTSDEEIAVDSNVKMIKQLPHGVVACNGISATDHYLSNGARYYLDVYSTPEIATAECLTLNEHLAHEIACERIAMHSIAAYCATQRALESDEPTEIVFNKRAADFTGASTGYHSNFLTDRRLDFDKQILPILLAHLATRVLFNGQGTVVTSPNTHETSYVLSQKISQENVNSSTSGSPTANKGLISTRDEPHSAEKYWRRLHVVSGDPNMSPWATLMSMGTVSLALRLTEWGELYDQDRLLEKVGLKNPILSAKQVSQDLDYGRTNPLIHENGRTALDIQKALIEAVVNLSEQIPLPADEMQVLGEWIRWADDLTKGVDYVADRVDSVIKKQLIDRMLDRKGLKITEKTGREKAQATDLLYSELSTRGIGIMMRAKGLYGGSMLPEEAIEQAMVRGPVGRARTRGDFIRANQGKITDVGWVKGNSSTNNCGFNGSSPFIRTAIGRRLRVEK